MKAALFLALAAIALAACQHGPGSGPEYLVPGATDVNLDRTIADGPGKHEKPRLLVIRAPAQVQLEQIEVARYRGNPDQRDLLCTGWGQCDKTPI
jgi:hypothetical protein